MEIIDLISHSFYIHFICYIIYAVIDIFILIKLTKLTCSFYTITPISWRYRDPMEILVYGLDKIHFIITSYFTIFMTLYFYAH